MPFGQRLVETVCFYLVCGPGELPGGGCNESEQVKGSQPKKPMTSDLFNECGDE